MEETLEVYAAFMVRAVILGHPSCGKLGHEGGVMSHDGYATEGYGRARKGTEGYGMVRKRTEGYGRGRKGTEEDGRWWKVMEYSRAFLFSLFSTTFL